ncbi:Lysosomal cobalamin transport escort protein LMBD1 [Apodemus speciosus]|uniref:Lysosomal cobalamin transport escort protein LMBD1 n=1 Tax=Apodemus speciosus TaxID=105296 RepID=A0ABQ0EDA6_APOSI
MAAAAAELVIGWCIFGLSLLLLYDLQAILAFCWVYVRKYQSQRESEVVSTVTAIFSLAVALITSALLPVDIFLVSYMKNQNGTFKDWANANVTVQIENTVLYGYYTLYSVILFCVFFWIPFVYFYYEEKDEDDSSKCTQIKTALKYTLGFVVICALLLLVGAFVPLNLPSNNNSTEWEKVKLLFEDLGTGQGLAALSFSISSLTLIGMLAAITYTAYGMSALPLNLIKGTRSTAYERLENTEDIEEWSSTSRQSGPSTGFLCIALAGLELRNPPTSASLVLGLKACATTALAHISNILQKPTAGRSVSTQAGQAVSVKWQWPLFELCTRLWRVQPYKGCLICQICDKDGRPLSARDRRALKQCEERLRTLRRRERHLEFIENSWWTKFCGALRPLKIIWGIFFILVALLFVISLFLSKWIRNIGIWFFWIRLYKIRRGRTRPQALLFLCMILLLIVLHTSYMIYSLAPQYVMYGSQNYLIESNITSDAHKGNSTLAVPKRCDADAPKDQCTVTRTYVFLHKFWFFSAAYYFGNWAFLGVFLIGLIVSCCKGKKSVIEGVDEDSDLSDDEPSTYSP